MFALTHLFLDFGSGIVCLTGCFGRKLVLFFVMGRKGKRVHEQSEGNSAQAFDYETIRIIPTQKSQLELDLLHLLASRLEEIWIFGALCLYWCDVELHI